MKRFFSFLLFVLLLSVAVATLWVWKVRRRAATCAPAAALFRQRRTTAARHVPEKYTVADGPRINVNDVDVLAAMSRQRILLAKAVVPSVVSITTSKSAPAQPSVDDPLFRFFHPGRAAGGGDDAARRRRSAPA